MTPLRQALKKRGPHLCAGLFVALLAVPASGAGTREKDEAWLDEPPVREVPQVGRGELQFLVPPPVGPTLHSRNSLRIDSRSLRDGWVSFRQCYEGLDAVPEAEVVYRYRNMRGLRIHSKANIGRAFVRGNSVQLVDVAHAATLCVEAEAQVLYALKDGTYILRNGPFHRRFLDGYFPLHVSLQVDYPPDLLGFRDTSPRPQPGFSVKALPGAVHIDTWFAGTLYMEIRFSAR